MSSVGLPGAIASAPWRRQLVAIALVIMWAVPTARFVVGSGLLGGLVLAGALWMRRRKALTGESPEAPLHLRD